MRKLLFIFVLINIALNAYTQETQFVEDVTLMRLALKELHPGYSRYTSENELNNAWDQLEKLAENSSPLQFYAQTARVLSLIRCEHTKADLPKYLSEQKQQRMMPFSFRIFNNRMFVEASTAGLVKGTEILEINAIDIPTILKTIKPMIARDGFTDHTLDSKLEIDMDLIGSNLEMFLAPAVFGKTEYPEEIALQVKNEEKTTDLTVDTIDFASWQEMAGVPYRLNFKDAVYVNYYDNTAVLTVDTFVNYRQPVDAMEKFSALFKSFKEKGIKHLIVDLRNNGGGSDDAQMGLLKHLYNGDFLLNDKAWIAGKNITEWKDKVTTWDKRIFSEQLAANTIREEQGLRLPTAFLGESYQTQKPAKYAFQGSITMLTSVGNASGSAGLLAHIAQQENVTLIGEKTGGNQGGVTATVLGYLQLPISKISIRIPFIRNHYNLTDIKDGQGVTPDIRIDTTKQDWLDSKDPALNYALTIH